MRRSGPTTPSRRPCRPTSRGRCSRSSRRRPADLLGADGVGVADLGGVLDVLAAGQRRVAARPVGGERVDPALARRGVVARGRGVDEGDTLAVAQSLGRDLAEVRRLAGHVDGLALRRLQARQHHLGEPARDLRGALREQLAEHGGGRQLGGRRADVEQLAADGVEVVVAVAELDAGVALAGGEDVDLVREDAGVAGEHDQPWPALHLALGEPDRLAAGHPGGQPRVDGDVQIREDPAADPVEPGLLLVTTDGHHQATVEHRHARDLLRGAEDGAAGGVGLAGVGHRDLLGRHPEQVLGVLVEEGRRRARGVHGSLGGLLRGVPAPGQLAEVAGHVVLVTDPAGPRRLAQAVDGPLQVPQPAGHVGVGVRGGVRRRGDQRRRAGLVTADRPVVAGRHAQDEGDRGGDDEESTGADHDG